MKFKKALAEEQKTDKYSSVAEMLNYYLMLDEGVILHKDGESFSISYEVIAPDVDSKTDDSLDGIKETVRDCFNYLGVDYMIEANLISYQVKSYTKGDVYRDRVTALLEEERALEFTDNYSDFYNTKLVYTITYNKPATIKLSFLDRIKKSLVHKDEDDENSNEDRATKLLKEFTKEVSILKNLLLMAGIKLNVLKGKDLYCFLYRCVNEVERELKDFSEDVLSSQLYLSDVIANENVITGKNLKVGERFIKVISLDNKIPLDYYPTILNDLATLDLEFRFNIRYTFIDNPKAIKTFEERRERLRRKEIIGAGQGLQEITGVENQKVDTVSSEQAEELLEIIHSAKTGEMFGYLNMSIIVSDTKEEILKEKVLRIEETVRKENFNPLVEIDNPTTAWFGTLPSHGDANKRSNNVNTDYFCNILPTFGIWQGSPKSTYKEYPNNPALAELVTMGNRKWYYNEIDGDNGDTLMFGMKGGGKSTKLAQKIFSYLARYKNVRIIVSDYYEGLRQCVMSFGGRYIDIFDGKTKLAPFQRAGNDKYKHDFLIPWLHRILVLKVEEEREKIAGIQLHTGQHENFEKIILNAVNRLVKANKETGYELTFDNFITQLDNLELKEKFYSFLDSLPDGLLGGNDDSYLWKGDLIGYDKQPIFTDKPASFYEPLFGYLNNRLYDDSRVTIAIFDEARIEMNSPYLWKLVSQNITTDRHKKRHNTYCMQSVTDSVKTKDNGEDDIVFNINIKNRIYIPSKDIVEDIKLRKAYENQGLNEREIENLGVNAKGLYYIKQNWAGGSRMVQWLASDLFLWFTGITPKDTYLWGLFNQIHSYTDDTWVDRWLEIFNLYQEVNKNVTLLEEKLQANNKNI